MDISRNINSGKLFLCQKAYLEKVLCRFNMHQANAVTTSIGKHFKLSSSQPPTNEEDKLYIETVPCASGIGSLMYGMVCTKSDITFAVSVISSFIENLGRLHWEALKWTLIYIRGSKQSGFGIQANKGWRWLPHRLCRCRVCWKPDTMKSMTGYVFTLWDKAISRKSNLLPVVALFQPRR